MDNTSPSDLDGYRALIHLDAPFNAPLPVADAERTALVERLLGYLEAEHSAAACEQERRRALRALLTQRAPALLPDWFHTDLGRLLERERLERGQVDAATLPRFGSLHAAATRLTLWRGDITALKADAIVNAANAQLLGCFQPFHRCIDNAIHSAAGPRLREDCAAIMQLQGAPEATGRAKITRAYHLPARYILHTVGPIVLEGRIGPAQEQQLANCYRACLDLAARIPAICSIAFCCISTGVFGFPNRDAARIALQTVKSWLEERPQRFSQIVFDVFVEKDFDMYQNELNDRSNNVV